MKKVAFAVFSLFILLGSSIESQAQQVKVDNVYYSIGKDPKYGNVAVIDSCRVKGLLGLDLVLPSEVEIGGRIYPIKDVRNLQKVSANSVTIPGSVEVIKAKAFADATTRKIVIPKSVKRIEDRAFYNLKYLPDIVIPNSVRYLGDEVFANCRALLEVVLPKNVDHIGKGLFRDNNFLKKVRFPENMTELPEMTFYGCKKLLNLEHLVMPALTKIGKKAFAGSSLMTCPLPQTVKTVDEEAFKGCGNLLTVFLPGVSRIEREAFADCPKLKVYFKGNTPQYVADDAFRGTEYEAKKNGSGSGGSATAQNRPSTSQTKNTSASSPKPKTGTSGSSQQNRIYTDEQMAQVST
ncbi:MAG: leucine-rich repeat domain-containing protein, partial [Candidatus Cryptobacteroides sp.]